MTRRVPQPVTIDPPRILRSGLTDDASHARPHRAHGSGPAAFLAAVPPDKRIKPVVAGSLAAFLAGGALGLGPVPHLAAPFLAVADAQENGASPAASAAEPSEADKAALRYFARQGDVERLEAELRRLRALYPGWQPSRNLLDPEGEDVELQAVWDLFGRGDYEGALAAIRERQEREPGWTPPAELDRALRLAIARDDIVEASDAGRWQEVLDLASQNEALLTCANVDTLWRVADAFAKTGNTRRAYDAYAYVLTYCENPAERIASLQKAADTLTPAEITELFALERTGAAGAGEFEAAKLDIVRGAVARGGEDADYVVPDGWLAILADSARGGPVEDAVTLAWYLYRHGNPEDAAGWFRYALSRGAGPSAAEGYIVSLRATGDREKERIAREVAYAWRNESATLMDSYLNAVASLLTADFDGYPAFEDADQGTVDRFVPVVIEQRDANGAQALGWYAFNTCQFIIAEEWFITSANWQPTEAALFGLALSRLRIGDLEGFREVVDEWGGIYPAVAALELDVDRDPEDPVTGDPDDPTRRVGVESVVCDPDEIERLRERARLAGNDVVMVAAGTATAGPPVGAGREARTRTVQRDARPAIPRPDGERTRRTADGTTATVERRVRQDRDEDGPRRLASAGPVRTGGGGTAAQGALSARNYARCVAITDRGIRSGTLSADDALARGYCLLELERPVEAAEAFQLAFAGTRYATTRYQDAAYGRTLAALASRQTDEAAIAATAAPQSRARRTEVTIEILTQRALAAYEDGRYVEAILYLDERDGIAPLQNDLMVLRGFAHYNIGEYREARRLFDAVNRTGTTNDALNAFSVVNERVFTPASNRMTF